MPLPHVYFEIGILIEKPWIMKYYMIMTTCGRILVVVGRRHGTNYLLQEVVAKKLK